jgi:hypothetical protein
MALAGVGELLAHLSEEFPSAKGGKPFNFLTYWRMSMSIVSSPTFLCSCSIFFSLSSSSSRGLERSAFSLLVRKVSFHSSMSLTLRSWVRAASAMVVLPLRSSTTRAARRLAVQRLMSCPSHASCSLLSLCSLILPPWSCPGPHSASVLRSVQ